MLVPTLYAIVVGYYYYHMHTHPREPDDVMFVRSFYSLLGLAAMGAADVAALAVTRWLPGTDGTNDGRSYMWLYRSVAIGCMLAATFGGWSLVREHVTLQKELGRLLYSAEFPELLDKLQDANPEIRRTAAAALNSRGARTPKLRSIFIQLANNPDEFIREQGVSGLLAWKDSPPVFERILRAAHRSVRSS